MDVTEEARTQRQQDLDSLLDRQNRVFTAYNVFFMLGYYGIFLDIYRTRVAYPDQWIPWAMVLCEMIAMVCDIKVLLLLHRRDWNECRRWMIDTYGYTDLPLDPEPILWFRRRR